MQKILVVDDDPAVLALLQIVGTRAGFLVDTAADGLEALDKLQSENYAITVLDLMMPRVSGYDVLEQLRGSPSRPVIVVVTAMTGSYVTSLDPSIVHAIIRKPFDVEVMASVLTDLASLARKMGSEAPSPPIQRAPQSPNAC